jgi:hypothetical protein
MVGAVEGRVGGWVVLVGSSGCFRGQNRVVREIPRGFLGNLEIRGSCRQVLGVKGVSLRHFGGACGSIEEICKVCFGSGSVLHHPSMTRLIH